LVSGSAPVLQLASEPPTGGHGLALLLAADVNLGAFSSLVKYRAADADGGQADQRDRTGHIQLGGPEACAWPAF